MEFGNIYYLILPIFSLFFYILFNKYLESKAEVINHFGSSDSERNRKSLRYSKRAFLAFCAAFFFISIAISEPNYISGSHDTIATDNDLFLVVDVSSSMNADDLSPSRLFAAQELARKVVTQIDAQFGLIAFTQDAYLLSPITSSKKSILLSLSNLNPNSYSNQGTDISSALNLLSKSFSQESSRNKYALIITDSEFHDKASKKYIDKLLGLSINTIIISLGTEVGADLHINNDLGEVEKVRTIANHFEAGRLADKLGGKHYEIKTIEDLGQVYNDISQDIGIAHVNEYFSLASIFLLLSFFVLLIYNKP